MVLTYKNSEGFILSGCGWFSTFSVGHDFPHDIIFFPLEVEKKNQLAHFCSMKFRCVYNSNIFYLNGIPLEILQLCIKLKLYHCSDSIARSAAKF